MTRAASVLAAALAVASTAGCALFPSDPSNESIRATVSSVSAPSGWTEVGSLEPACAVLNVDCQDSSVRRVFRAEVDAAAACSDVVAYLAAVPLLSGAQGLAGATPQDPSAGTCAAELAAYGRYVVLADGPAGNGTEQWRLRLTPAGRGYELSVVLGDPPRDPWS